MSALNKTWTIFKKILRAFCYKTSCAFSTRRQLSKRYYLANPYAFIYITEREKSILFYFMQGKVEEEIATTLVLHPRTIEYFINNLIKKTGSTSRIELLNHPGIMEFAQTHFESVAAL